MEDRASKQQFLRNEIIDKGYNPDDFISFLDTKKLGEFDIDNFTFDELKNYVNEFIVFYNSGSILNKTDLDNSNHPFQISDQDKHKIDELDVKSNREEEKEYQTHFTEVIKCMKHQETVFSSICNLIISVSKPEKQKGGLFASDFVTYLITIDTFETQVRRRYSDFDWLREKLILIFPHFMIPPIPKKTSKDRFSDKLLLKRTKGFEKFLDSLSKNKDIKDSKIFFDFLQAEDQAFPAKKKEYDTIKTIASFPEIKNSSGEMTIRMSQDYDKIHEGVKNYLTFKTSLLKKLKFCLRQLSMELSSLTNRLKDVSDIFSSLELLSEKSFDNDIVKESYVLLGKNIKVWKESVENQMNIIENDYVEFFKYIRKEYLCFQSNITKTENAKNEYLKFERNLLQKKEQLFRSQKINKWELSLEEYKKPNTDLLNNKDLAFTKMCFKDNINLLDLKKIYALYSTSLFEEYDRIRNLNGERYNVNFIQSATRQLAVISNLNDCLVQIQSFYNGTK